MATTATQRFGVIGLGRMGGGLALQARDRGFEVVGLDPSGVHPELQAAGVEPMTALSDLTSALAPPRVVFLYIPAGPGVDTLLDELVPVLSPGDVIVDGGNSYWGDSIRRHKRIAPHAIELVDACTSGGLEGARHGACFMVGGTVEAVAQVEPIFKALAVEGGYVHAGPPGAGHFTKLVHNGIEFGMLQAIGEGIELLRKYESELDLAGVLSCWRHGSVIRGWLIDLMHEEILKYGGLDEVSSFVEDTGEVNWLVADALQMEIPIPVIAMSVMELFASRDEKHVAARAVAMMRHGFGGHPYGRAVALEEERKVGQVGGTFREPLREHVTPRPPRPIASHAGARARPSLRERSPAKPTPRPPRNRPR
jgi:6-phosphogluconate dehydrogenase